MGNPAVLGLRRGRKDDEAGIKKDACHPAAFQIRGHESLAQQICRTFPSERAVHICLAFWWIAKDV